jgi:nucleoside-diphosphate-sugar epimerase
MKVLVTGATGFLGAALVGRLLAEGERVRVLARDAYKAHRLFGTRVEILQGDLLEAPKVAAALKDIEVIYHLAGRLYHPSIPAAHYFETHVEGTRVLLQCCRDLPGLSRLVHCSTTGVYGVTGLNAADEASPYAPTNPYEQSKLAGEKLALRAHAEVQLPVTVVRPALVYGPGDLHLLGFFRQVARGLPATIAGGRAYIHPIYIDDMSRSFLLAARLPHTIGRCYNIAGHLPVSFTDLAGTIANVLKCPPCPLSLPTWMAYGAAMLFRWLLGMGEASAPLTASRIDFLTHSRVYSCERARRDLQFTPQVGLNDGIRYTIAWYREHGYL